MAGVVSTFPGVATTAGISPEPTDGGPPSKESSIKMSMSFIFVSWGDASCKTYIQQRGIFYKNWLIHCFKLTWKCEGTEQNYDWSAYFMPTNKMKLSTHYFHMDWCILRFSNIWLNLAHVKARLKNKNWLRIEVLEWEKRYLLQKKKQLNRHTI